jgi:polysaccharide biosynthesis protein PslH
VNVLFLAQRVPYPLDRGDKIRAYHELRTLAERGHAVHLVAFAEQGRDELDERALASLCASVTLIRFDRRPAALRALADLATGRGPLSLAYFGSAGMMEAVRRRVADAPIEAVLVCSSSMAQYIPARLVDRTVVDLVDVDSEKWRDYARRIRVPYASLYRIEAQRLRRYEQYLLRSCAHVVVTTPREAALLPSAHGRAHVITNGVDLDYFRPTAQRHHSNPRLAFTGVMDYPPNVDGVRYFASEVLPLIRRLCPEAEFVIVGSYPTWQVRRLAGRPGVTVTGRVPDTRPYLAEATASIAPLRIARGIQNKVLEAMASGCPVISTPAAVAGLRVIPGEHLLVASDGQGLADACLQVLRDIDLRSRLSEQARQFVEREHRWGPPMPRLCELLEGTAA